MSDKSNTKIFHTTNSGAIMTPEGRLFFAKFLHTAHENKQGKMQYALELCLPPETDLKPLKLALFEVAMQQLEDKDKAKLFVNQKFLNPRKLPKGGDRGEEFEGWTLIRANTTTSQPDFVWPNGERMDIETARNTIKSGFWVRATVNPYWFKEGGVTLGLQNIQFLKQGAVIGFNKPDGEDEFVAVEGAENAPKKSASKSTEKNNIDELFD